MNDEPQKPEPGRGADDVAPAGSRAPDPPSAPAPARVPLCDLCGSPMLERHCRLICTQCGYQRDCSDP
jgi:hypothetical protein